MRISVDGSRIHNNKVAFSNLSGIVWTGPICKKWINFDFGYTFISVISQHIIILSKTIAIFRAQSAPQKIISTE